MTNQNIESINNDPLIRDNLDIVDLDKEKKLLHNDTANRNIFSRNINKILIGCAALSMGFTLVSDDVEELKDSVVEAAPWVSTGVVASEIAFIGGLAIMGTAVGSSVKNPLKLRQELPNMVTKANESLLFKSGFWINAAGAVGDFTVLSAGVLKEMPPSSWGFLGLTLTDLAGTIGVRKWALETMKNNKVSNNNDKEKVDKFKEKSPINIEIRRAVIDDAEGLVDLDLSRFKKAYGENIPDREELKSMFQKRIKNAGNWMYVIEIDSIIEGFMTAFRTNKPHEEFISWEQSTNDGTLDGCVEDDGRFIYIANMTMSPRAMKAGSADNVIIELFAEAVKHGIEYEYFISRMPLFGRWLRSEMGIDKIDKTVNKESGELLEIAKYYSTLKKATAKGDVLYDPELRMYSEMGITLERVVENGFQDEASLDFGVVCKIDVPPKNKFIKRSSIARSSLAKLFKYAAKHPKILERLGY